MLNEPTLTCYYAVPAAKGGRPSPRKDDVVYFFHTPGPKIKNILDNGICNRLVSELGMSVLASHFKIAAKRHFFMDQTHLANDSIRFQNLGRSRRYSLLGRPCVGNLRLSDPIFFLYGYSAGGIGVQRFAEEYPDYCAGIVSVNGHTFTQKYKASCPVLVIHSYGDGGAPSGNGLLLYYQQIQTPCIRLMLSPSWKGLKEGNDGAFHAVNGGVVELASAFLEGIADLRAQSKTKRVPPVSEWSYVATYEDPLLITKALRTITPVLFGNKTPMPIPSARFYAALVTRPLMPLRIETKDGDAFLIRPRVDQATRGTIFIISPEENLIDVQRNGYANDNFVDGQFFAEHGFSVLIAKSQDAIKEIQGRAINNEPNQLRCAMLRDPAPGTLINLISYSHLVVSFTTPTLVEPYLDEFQRLLQRGTRLIVLLPYRTRVEYENALQAINPTVRK